ncbi:3-ketoacyl-ACP reductase [Mariniphaga sediminis]|jgi:NAD(P)-dependent dehydrogenase (short-subunit alcohol dehydrogenase family)|uniref:3-ketoacyl-ACP reductase n=1 Tax=Mariniphaga sediminis TaxID=1628158 RepID=A0A399D3N6_9BACT|nr:3-ketoacyl-ACP reductase [Mariniphaga sediminis]RIH66033.1 3-ketoacyl-ACP reductase [Mariniphaga sediminis]
MNKTALITGGSRGIGLGIARELAKAGFNLAINGVRNQESVQPVLNELSELGTDVIYVKGDVSKAEDREQILQTVTDRFGNLNVLVNNAGIAPRERKDILEASEDIFDEVLQINLKGPYFLTQLFARHMVESKKKDPGFPCCIINVSSVSATVASTNRGEYCISKAGIAMATRLWAARLGEFDIPVYEIQPGVIATDMTSGVTGKYDRLFEQGLCIQKRWGLPEDVGKVAAAMATGLLPYSTGQVVMVDGGMTIQRL